MKGNSLELLEYGSDVENEKEPGPTLEEYQLPQLPPPPSSYHECITADRMGTVCHWVGKLVLSLTVVSFKRIGGGGTVKL
jgi:hypothetical protein